jgi:hypothetical protein
VAETDQVNNARSRYFFLVKGNEGLIAQFSFRAEVDSLAGGAEGGDRIGGVRKIPTPTISGADTPQSGFHSGHHHH